MILNYVLLLYITGLKQSDEQNYTSLPQRKNICFSDQILTSHVFYITADDCFRCDYSQGQMWLQYKPNCHQFYVCEPDGKGGYIKHLMTCGHLFWNQAQHTCTEVKTGLCYENDPVAYTGPPIVDGMFLTLSCIHPAFKGVPTSTRVVRYNTNKTANIIYVCIFLNYYLSE